MPNTTATPKKFTMQQAFEVLLRKPSDKSVIAYLDDVKSSGLENTAEMVYPQGGRGNLYIGGGFSHSKRATMTISTATWRTEVLAIQNGTEVYTGTTTVTVPDEIEPVKAGTAYTYTTQYKPVGTSGSEIGFLYKVMEDGTYGQVFTQGSSAASGVFVLSSQTITFSTADATDLAGSNIFCAYTRNTTEAAQSIDITGDSIPEMVIATAYGMAKDVCTGELFPCQVEGVAQVDGNYNFDLSADGDPSVQNLNLEFVRACKGKNLYRFTVYTDDAV